MSTSIYNRLLTQKSEENTAIASFLLPFGPAQDGYLALYHLARISLNYLLYKPPG